MPEHWLPVVGFEGSYEVSDRGRVRSLDRISSQGIQLRGQVLKLHPVSDRGYLKADLYRAGRAAQRLVHRIVLEAFAGPCPEGMEGCHNDGDTSNNAVENLRWDTHSENNFDIVRHGNHHHARKTHCKRGHLLEAPNLCGGASAARGWRRCRACSRELDSARLQGREFEPARADEAYQILMDGEHR